MSLNRKFICINRTLFNDDIEAIINRGDERTQELNSRYEGLNLDDLNNFKSDASVQQWEGEDYRAGAKMALNMSLLAPSKRERKSNYSVDSYFKDTLRAGPAKVDKGPKVPRAPKQVTVYVFRHTSLACSICLPMACTQTRLPVLP
jgi:SWI/SNF-related matrix-associated actin-dependent regulator of chromatin subfamily A member 5